MQFAIERVRLAGRKTSQHLPRMVPERRSNLRHHNVSFLHAPHARKLPGYPKIGRIHRCDPDVVDNICRTVRDVSTFDQITEFAFVQTRLQTVTQRRHSEIAKMRTDTQPIELLRGLHLTQTDIVTIEILQLS